jgi:hypothetical protein
VLEIWDLGIGHYSKIVLSLWKDKRNKEKEKDE